MTIVAAPRGPGGRDTIVWLLALSCGLGLCAGCPDRPARVQATGGVVIRGAPSDAQVFVDDRYVGTIEGLGGRPLMLRQGLRLLEIRKEGYFAYYGEVRVVKGVRQQLQVQLEREPF